MPYYVVTRKEDLECFGISYEH